MKKQNVWDHWAKKYNALSVQRLSLAPTRKEILLYLEEIFSKDKKYKILDVGCGTGQLLQEIQTKFKDYKLNLSGIDFSKEMINKAKSIGQSIDFQQLDVKDIQTLDGKYDIIICTHSLPYYENQALAIKQIRRMIKDDGYLLLAHASENNLYDHLVLSIVKLSTGKAYYPSVKSIKRMTAGLFQWEKFIKIKVTFYMPSIYLFVLRGS